MHFRIPTEALHMSRKIIIALRKYELNQYRKGSK